MQIINTIFYVLNRRYPIMYFSKVVKFLGNESKFAKRREKIEWQMDELSKLKNISQL